jgi:hypothetical protein
MNGRPMRDTHAVRGDSITSSTAANSSTAVTDLKPTSTRVSDLVTNAMASEMPSGHRLALLLLLPGQLLLAPRSAIKCGIIGAAAGLNPDSLVWGGSGEFAGESNRR